MPFRRKSVPVQQGSALAAKLHTGHRRVFTEKKGLDHVRDPQYVVSARDNTTFNCRSLLLMVLSELPIRVAILQTDMRSRYLSLKSS